MGVLVRLLESMCWAVRGEAGRARLRSVRALGVESWSSTGGGFVGFLGGTLLRSLVAVNVSGVRSVMSR